MPEPREPRRPEDLLALTSRGTAMGADPMRPKAIVYTSILAIMIGAVGFLGCGLASGLMGFAHLGESTYLLPDQTPAVFPQGIAQYMAIMGSADLALSAALMAAGFGGYYIRPWARKLGLAASPLIIAAAIVRLVAFITYVNPQEVAMLRLLEQHPATQPAAQPAATQPAATQPATSSSTGPAMASATAPSTAPAATVMAPGESQADKLEAARPMVGGVTFAIQVAVPILILMLWTRSSVRAVFESRSSRG